MLGKRKPDRQHNLFIATGDLAKAPAHGFYDQLNQLLAQHDFDAFVETLCVPFYQDGGRPGLPPGIYFRMLFIGFFEGIDSQRGIDWRCQDSLSLRKFLGVPLNEPAPDHSTLSMTRLRAGHRREAPAALAQGIAGAQGHGPQATPPMERRERGRRADLPEQSAAHAGRQRETAGAAPERVCGAEFCPRVRHRGRPALLDSRTGGDRQKILDRRGGIQLGDALAEIVRVDQAERAARPGRGGLRGVFRLDKRVFRPNRGLAHMACRHGPSEPGRGVAGAAANKWG
jgi:hypothetical protein